MQCRSLLSRLAFLRFSPGVASNARSEEAQRPLKIMFKSASGSDDPTKLS